MKRQAMAVGCIESKVNRAEARIPAKRATSLLTATWVVALIGSLFVAPARAQTDAETKKFEQQAKRYHSLLMRRPRRGTGFDLVFRLYLDAGRLDELVAHYESEIKKDPKDPAPMLVSGLILERRGHFDEALERLAAAQKLKEDDFYVHYYQATILHRLHRHKQAIDSLEKAIKLKPPKVELLDCLKRLGRLHTRDGEIEKAQAIWKQLTTMFPNDRLALEELAELLVEEEQFDEAIKQYEKLEQLAKRNRFQALSARVEIGQIQVRQGKLKTAIATFESCLDQLRSASWQAKDIRRRIEEIFQRSDDLAGLAQYYQEYLKKHADDLEVRLSLAKVLSMSGQRKQAIEQYEKALEVAPTHVGMRRALITEYVDDERIDDAIDEAEQLIKLQKDDIESLLLLGDLYLQKSTGEAAEKRALDAWSKIAAIRADDPLLALKVAEKCRQTVGIGSRLGTDRPASEFETQRDGLLAKAALEYYQKAVSRADEPVAVEYIEYLAEYQFTIGLEKDALASWKSIIAPPRDNVTNLRRLAEIYTRANRDEDAIDVIVMALKKPEVPFDVVELATHLRLKRLEFDLALKHVDALEKLADTPFSEERSLQVRVEVLAAANRLESELVELDKRLQANGSVRDYFLASMISTGQQHWTRSLKYLEGAIKLAPKDTRLFRYKAQVHQQGGDLSGAAEQFRALAKIEPGKRTLHLKEVVALELEMGRIDRAQQAADEIVRFAPENPEALQLLADVAFRAGKNEEGLRALQRSVRVDPRNADTRMVLARKLSDLNRVDESIEHTWRALELADTLEAKMNVVALLAEKYAIAGETKQLIERLEQMQDKNEDVHQTTLMLAQVHVYSEDFVAARKSLGELLSKRPNDLTVLTTLVQLSQRLGDVEQAIDYQKRIYQVAKDPAAEEQLARLYTTAGETEKAKEIWLRLAQRQADDKTALRTADRSLRNREFENVVAICRPKWNKNGDDWRFGYRLMLSLWFNKQQDESLKVAESMLRLAPHRAYKNEIEKNQRNRPRFNQTYPPEAQRLQNVRQVFGILSQPIEQGGNQSPFSYIQFNELADAQMLATMVRYQKALQDKKQKEFEEELAKKGESSVAALQQLAWVQMSDFRKELADTITKLIEKSPDNAEARLVQMTMPFFGRSQGQVSKEQIVVFEKQYAWFKDNRQDLLSFVSMGYMQMLMQAGDEERSKKVALEVIARATKVNDLVNFNYMFARGQDIELIKAYLDKLNKLTNSSNSSYVTGNLVVPLTTQYLQLAAQKKEYDTIVETVVSYLNSTHPSDLRGSGSVLAGLSSSAGHRQTIYSGSPFGSTAVGTNTNAVSWFPSKSVFLDSARFQLLYSAQQTLRRAGRSKLLQAAIEKQIESSEDVAKNCWRMANIYFNWWEGQRNDVVGKLAALSKDLPAQVQVRLMSASALAQIGKSKEALQALDPVRFPFGAIAKDVEQLRLQLAIRSNDDEAGKQAALRLFGMRLSSREQVQLAKSLRRYGLGTRSDALLNRAVRTAGNRQSELVQIMQQYVDREPKRAASVAKLILQQTRSAAPNSSAANYRTQAYQILKRTGDLEKMIKSTEGQLEQAPKSTKLLESLSELYVASGDDEKALATLKRVTKIRPNDANLRYQIAQTFIRRRAYAEAVGELDIVWEKNPNLILSRGYEIARYYLQAKKLDKLREHILKLKGSTYIKQNPYNLTNIVENLQYQNAKVEDVAKLYEAAVEVIEGEYRGYAFQQYANFLTEKGKKDMAYDVYRKSVFKVDPKESRSPRQQFENSVLNYYSRLADLATELKKLDALEKETKEYVNTKLKKSVAGEVMLAMIERRRKNEKPLTELGIRAVASKESMKSFGPSIGILRSELNNCSTKDAVKAALKVWTYDDGSGGQSRSYTTIARLWIKLDNRKEARAALYEAAKQTNHVHYGGAPVESEFRSKQQIADAFYNNQFYLDAARFYGEVVELNLSQVRPSSSTLRYNLPTVIRNLTTSVQRVRSKGLDQAYAELLEELKKKDQDRKIGRYFVAVDPPSLRQEAYRNRNSGSAKKTKGRKAPDDQLLPTVLKHARQKKQLAELKKSIKAIRDAAGKRELPDGDVLDAMDVLIQITESPKASVPAVKKWLERVRSRPLLAGESPTWLVAHTATFYPATEVVGAELALLVSKESGPLNKLERQQAALAAAMNVASAESLLKNMLAKSTDPNSMLQMAMLQFEQEKHDEAIKLMSKVWATDSDLAAARINELLPHYVAAKQLKALAKGIADAPNFSAVQNSSSNMARLFRSLPNDPELVDGAVELYKAIYDTYAPNNASYISSQFSNYLGNVRNKQKVFEASTKLLVSKYGEDSHRYLMGRIVSAAKTTKSLPKLKAICEKAAKDDPSMAVRMSLIIAIADRELGNEDSFVKLSERYVKEAAFAAQMKSYESYLRSELMQCKKKENLELALRLWREYLGASQGNAQYAVSQVASVLQKLDRKPEAKKILLEQLERPAYTGNSDADYAAQQQMDQASGISGSLKNVGYPIESLEALDRIYRVDLSVVREDSYVFSQISQYMNNGHSTLKEYDKEKKRDEVAKQLVKLLQGDKNPRLAGFFTLLGTDSRNARQQVKGIPSLLPRLLGHYKGKPTLKELDAAVDQAYVKYANDPHVLGMYCAINLYTGDKKAWSEAAAKLLPLVTKNKALKQSSLPWVVALAGFENGQVNKDLESLLNLVLEEGKKSRQTLRQKQIVAVLTKATTKYKVPELSAVMERLVGGSYSPEGHVELGIGLLEAKQLAEAERVLGMVWKKDSKFIMESFEKVAPAYAKAGKIDLLIKSFSTVTDQQILNNNSYRVVNAASSLTNKKETLEDGIKLLYKAAEKAEANRDYAMRNLVSTLTRKKRVDEALKAYHAHIMPPKGKKHNSTLLAGYAKLAFDNKVIAELEKDCRKHIKETPEWEANGQLLLAICQRLQDNEKLFDDLVDRMGTDPAFKTKMQSFGSTLTEELSKCKSEKPLRFALAELQRLASNSRGSQSHQGYVKVAGVYAKLNERSKALASFDNALSAPMPNYGGDYQIYQQYRRSVDVADAMVAQGFALAGLKLYDKCIEEADTELIRNYAGSNNAGRLQTKAEAALGKAMVEDLKSTLDQLIRDAGNRKEDLGGYFFVSKRPFKWPVRSKFPQKLRNAKLARQQLLLALLAEAKSTNRTSELRKALTDVKLDEPSIYRQALVAVTSEQFDSDAWIKRVNTSKQTKSTANMMVLLYLLADKQTTKDGVALFRKTLGQDLKTSKPQQLALLVDALPRYASEKLLSENQAAAKRLKRYNESEMKRAQSRNQNLYAIWHLDQLMVNNPSIENKFARAQLLVKLNRFKPAIAQYQEVVKTKPEHFAKLAGIQARTKDWKSASQSFIAGLKEKPDDHWDWFRSSILSAHLGDEADYKRQCDEMVKRYAEKSEWWLLERMVKANAISAKPSNLKKIAEVIDKLAKKESSNHWVILSKGIVDYRTGKFDSALTHLDKAITSSRKESKYASSLGFAFKAMSLQKKKKSVEAKKALENAQADFKAIQVRKDGMLSTSWHDWLMSDMAIKEASSLVK